MEAYLSYKLTKWAFSSGELKMAEKWKKNLKGTFQFYKKDPRKKTVESGQRQGNFDRASPLRGSAELKTLKVP